MNNVTLIGRLTKNPELKKTDEGRSICTFTLAVDDIHAKEDRADFIRITVFGTQGENCEKYLRKGFLAAVSGRFRSDSYTDSEGIVRYPIGIIADRCQFLQWPEKTEKKEDTPVANEEKVAVANKEKHVISDDEKPLKESKPELEQEKSA